MTSTISYPSSNGSGLGASDPIAGAIALLRPQTVVEAPFLAVTPWAVRHEPFPHVKIGGVVLGTCWLALQGHEPVLLEEGDFFLLGNPPAYVLAGASAEQLSAGGAPTAQSLRAAARDANAVPPVHQDQADVYLCSGVFLFDDANASVLMDVLPPLVLVRAGDLRGTLLAHVSALLIAELGAGDIGGAMVLDHLAQIMFVHVLRAHAEQDGRPTGWLHALSDDGVGAALRAMHGDVAHRWTLAELAAVARMSRSAFATAFKRQVGTAPLEYLIAWRMNLARDSLRRGDRTITQLASATGYLSDSAFSTAFRRETGTSPREFRDTTSFKP